MLGKLVIAVSLLLLCAPAAGAEPKLPRELAIHRPQDEDFVSYAHDVSADGSVIVGKYRLRGLIRAFRWENGKMELLPSPGQGVESRAFAVSPDGSVVVGEMHSGTRVEAFRWGNGEVTGLGHMEGGLPYSTARDVADQGRAVVGFARADPATLVAVRWMNGKMEILPSLRGGRNRNEARGVSDDGTVVVGLTRVRTGRQAAMWRNGRLWPLGSLPGRRKQSVATGVSGDGNSVVGYAPAEAGIEAFLWSWKDRKMRSLGPLEGATPALASIQTNRDGSIVVASSNLPGGQSGFRWEAGEGGGSRVDFDDPRLLRSGFGVSDDGRVMIGQQLNEQGTLEAFRWEEGVFTPLGHPAAAAVSKPEPRATKGSGATPRP